MTKLNDNSRECMSYDGRTDGRREGGREGHMSYLHMSCSAKSLRGGSVSSAIRDKSIPSRPVPCTMKVQRGSSTPREDADDDDDGADREGDVVPMRERAF